MLGNGCAGVDDGDGFDCYGVPVDPDDPRTRRLTGVEKASVWERLRLPDKQRYTFEETAHVKAGTFGIEGLTLYRQQTGDTAQALLTVNVIGRNFGFVMLVGLITLAVAYSSRPRGA